MTIPGMELIIIPEEIEMLSHEYEEASKKFIAILESEISDEDKERMKQDKFSSRLSAALAISDKVER
jgi:hypothetical protein